MRMSIGWLMAMVFFVLIPLGPAIRDTWFSYVVDKERKRADAMKEMAAELKLSFSPEVNLPVYLSELPPFDLFAQGRGRWIGNLLRTSVGDVAVTIFDFAYSSTLSIGSPTSYIF